MNVWGSSAHLFDNFNYLVPYLDMIKRVIQVVLSQNPTVVLDLGCGTGNLEKTLKLLKPQCKIVGTDIAFEMLVSMKSKSGDVSGVGLDLNHNLSFHDESFDVVTSIHSLYMVNCLRQGISEIKRVLKKNGKLVLVHPNKRSVFYFIRAHFTSREIRLIFLSIANLLGLLKLLSKGFSVEKNFRSNFLRKEELESFLLDSGFRICLMEDIYGGISSLVVAEKL